MADVDVAIVGAGIAGLCCGRELKRQGFNVRILEATDQVGGRIKTDVVDGFRLDHGFQVLLTAYPACTELLNYDALDLKPFDPGSLVQLGGKRHLVSDPFRRPGEIFKTVFAPIGSLSDKLKILKLRSRSQKGSLRDLFSREESTTLERLKSLGFSDKMINRFFKPFLSGIFLEPDLTTSSRMLEFVFRMFSLGETAIPNSGMGEIPKQLAADFEEDEIQTLSPVMRIDDQVVELETGTSLSARAIVIATDGPAAANLVNVESPGSCSVTCYYFAAPQSPLDKPILLLNGDGRGPINNLCVPTDIASGYGPGDSSLISVSVVGKSDSKELLQAVQIQLTEWFGNSAQEWTHLKTYQIRHALPTQPVGQINLQTAPELREGLFLCGDYRRHASIQGALESGRLCAQAVTTNLNSD